MSFLKSILLLLHCLQTPYIFTFCAISCSFLSCRRCVMVKFLVIKLIKHLCASSRLQRTSIASSPITTILCAVARSVWRAKVRCLRTSWRDADKAAGHLKPSNSLAMVKGGPVRSPTAVCAPGLAPPRRWPPTPLWGPQAQVWLNQPHPPAPPGTCPLFPLQWCEGHRLHHDYEKIRM